MRPLTLPARTLLVIDRPGFSIFHERGPDGETPLEDLPLQIGAQDVIFRTRDEIDSFQESFTQALSLILNHRIQITYRWFCLGEERTFNLRDGSVAWPRPANRFRIPEEASEADIEKAKCLYERVVDFDSNDCTKLQIAIDRWIKSKASGNDVDRIIDLGIALEALYVTRKDKIERQFCHRASLYLAEDVASPEKLEAIYKYRSDVVHNRRFGEEVEAQSVSVSKLVKSAQCLCRKSILSIVNEGKFPDWDTLRQRAKRNG